MATSLARGPRQEQVIFCGVTGNYCRSGPNSADWAWGGNHVPASLKK
jgi:hypothetical protein